MPPAVADLGLSTAMTPRPYSARRNFKLDSAYPVVEGYQDALGISAVAAGMRFNFSDRLGATNLEFTASYSPDDRLDASERTHLRAVFRHWNWKLSGSLNRADFYDLFGPTKMSRRGYSLAAQYSGNIFLDGPTSFGYTLQAAQHGNLAILPEFQNVATAFDALTSLSGELSYETLRRSLGAIDDEVGTTWNAALRSNVVNGELYPRLSLDAAKGFLLPLDHSSIWLRTSAGSALAGNRTQPFARFFFGGFANNWVDHREIKQFRSTESFPGLEINEVGGATYAKAQVEWMLPPLRFRRVGVPSAYLRWANLSFFASGLVTDLDNAVTQRTFTSAGAQLDLRLVTLSHLDSTISFGYALATGEGVPLSSSYMLSFKIM